MVEASRHALGQGQDEEAQGPEEGGAGSQAVEAVDQVQGVGEEADPEDADGEVEGRVEGTDEAEAVEDPEFRMAPDDDGAGDDLPGELDGGVGAPPVVPDAEEEDDQGAHEEALPQGMRDEGFEGIRGGEDAEEALGGVLNRGGDDEGQEEGPHDGGPAEAGLDFFVNASFPWAIDDPEDLGEAPDDGREGRGDEIGDAEECEVFEHVLGFPPGGVSFRGGSVSPGRSRVPSWRCACRR